MNCWIALFIIVLITKYETIAVCDIWTAIDCMFDWKPADWNVSICGLAGLSNVGLACWAVIDWTLDWKPVGWNICIWGLASLSNVELFCWSASDKFDPDKIKPGGRLANWFVTDWIIDWFISAEEQIIGQLQTEWLLLKKILF